jgi:hypothetical protein
MKNPTPLFTLFSRTILIGLWISLFSACSHYSTMTLNDDLQANVYQFNKRFEGKMMDLSSAYVLQEKRKDFLVNSTYIKEKVTFYDSSILDIKFLDGNHPVQKTAEGAEKEVNQAIVTMRYQVAVLPSNQLRTILIDQVWMLNGEQWQVQPNLTPFKK